MNKTATQSHEQEKPIVGGAPDYEEGKLPLFNDALAELSLSEVEKDTFYNYFIGSVSIVVPIEEWKTAIRLASHFIAECRDRRNEP